MWQATHAAAAQIVLNTMIAMFSHLCDEPFTVEEVRVCCMCLRISRLHDSCSICAQVHVTLPSGKHRTYPVVQERPHAADLHYINSILGCVCACPTQMLFLS